MTLSGLPTPPVEYGADGAVLRAIACDAGVLAARAGSPSGYVALARARARGLRVGLVYDDYPSGPELRAATVHGDVIAVPEDDELTAGRDHEVRPEFVVRMCDRLGVEPAACIVIAGRRALLAAAAWVGTRTVMVPDDGTPLFDVRCQRLAPDLASAVDGALGEMAAR